jgi:N-acetylneuraminic acid mutarotase
MNHTCMREHRFPIVLVCVLLVLAVFFSLSTFLVPHAEAAENSWTTKADMPTSRLGPGVAVANGKIYVIGGTGGGGYLNTNEEYDPATDTWTTKKPMPTARASFGIAVYQNKIYCIGGGGDFGFEEVTGVNEVYDPLTDTWTTKTSMPTAREFLCANVVNGKIYLIGGSKPVNLNDPSFVPNVNEVYDPETDSWTTKTPPPTQVSAYASAVVDNKIYVIGGSPVGNLTQIYHPETDTWSYGAPIPNACWGAAAGATTGVLAPKRIYVIGGHPTFTLNQVYDPETDTWTMGAQMPTSRYGLGVAVVNDMLYAIEGTKNEQYTPFGFGTVPPTISIVSPENKTYTANNVSLTFTVNELTSWIGYSLDGQANVTIPGNTTLTGLSDGIHNLVVYAKDIAGNTGASEIFCFSIKTQQSEPFPTTWIVAAMAIIAIGIVAILVYFRKIRKTTGKAE